MELDDKNNQQKPESLEKDNLDIDIQTLEDFDLNDKTDNLDSLEEITLNVESDESFKLNKREDLYYKLYKSAKDKAKKIRKQAIKAYLEAKSIKDKYLVDDLETSSSEDESIDLEEDISD